MLVGSLPVIGLVANNFSDNAVQSRQATQGFALLESGKASEALETFEEALRVDGSDLPAMLGRAMVYSEQQAHQQAFFAYSSIVEAYPEHLFAWNRRGLAALNLEDFDEALYSFEQAIEPQPVNGFFYESLAWTHLCRGELKQAAEVARTAALMYNREGQNTLYPLLVAYFAYLQTGDNANADRTLAYAHKNRTHAWPTPVIDYLANRIDSKDLLSFVTESAEETEAHTYIGLKLRAMGELEAAARHLNWVARAGDSRVFEYTLARSIHLESPVAQLVP